MNSPPTTILATLLKYSPQPSGPWVRKNSGYDEEACEALSLTHENSRYWDGTLGSILVEIKKGRSIWIDLVRMAEHVVPLSEDAAADTITLFLVPDKKKERIEEALIVRTGAIIDELGVTEREGEMLQALKQAVPRSLNAQASLTLSDVRRLAEERITWSVQ